MHKKQSLVNEKFNKSKGISEVSQMETKAHDEMATFYKD